MRNSAITQDTGLRVSLSGIPPFVSQGPQILWQSGWPAAAEYDDRGRLVKLLNKDTMRSLPIHGPHEPMQQTLHRWADEKCPPAGYVYFIGHIEHAIKIGTTVDLKSRFASLQASSPLKLEMLATCRGGTDKEGAYHYQFHEHRLHGEWFSPHPDILAEIERLARPSDRSKEHL